MSTVQIISLGATMEKPTCYPLDPLGGFSCII
jgi:hypothetical protein